MTKNFRILLTTTVTILLNAPHIGAASAGDTERRLNKLGATVSGASIVYQIFTSLPSKEKIPLEGIMLNTLLTGVSINIATQDGQNKHIRSVEDKRRIETAANVIGLVGSLCAACSVYKSGEDLGLLANYLLQAGLRATRLCKLARG